MKRRPKQGDPAGSAPDGVDVEPLNGAYLDFGLDRVEIEELERRFEMALAVPPVETDLDCLCPNLKSCGTYCVPPP